ncbi:MAG: hypothetical protein KF713_15785 [Turneriella sp.]|nr:hypothetical protein [Turneriella sp.]
MSWLMKIPWIPKHDKKIHAVTYTWQILLMYFLTFVFFVLLFSIPVVERLVGITGSKVGMIGLVHFSLSVLPQILFKGLYVSKFVLWELFIDRLLMAAFALAASPDAGFMWIFFTVLCIMETFECGPSVFSGIAIFVTPFIAWHCSLWLGWRSSEVNITGLLLTVSGISALWWLYFSNATIQFRKAHREVESMHARAELEPMLRDEKNRINAELHDVIGSELALLALATTPVENPGVPGDIRPRLRRMLERLRELIMLNSMSPDLPERVTDELVERAHEVARVAKLDLECAIEHTVLSIHQAFHLQRFFFEALANTMRHAQAKKMVIRMKTRGNRKTMIIADDGRGFNKTTKAQGMGLPNLAERTRRLNGRLRIFTSEGKGTTVALRFS